MDNIDTLISEANVLFVDYENKRSFWTHNTITNRHRELYAAFLNGDSVTVPSHIAFGNIVKESSEDGAAFSALKSEYARVALTSKVLASTTTTRMVAAVPGGTASGNIDELGLLNAAATSTQISAADVTTNWNSDGTLSIITSISTNTGSYTHLEGVGSLRAAITGNGGSQSAFDNWSLDVNAQSYDTGDFLQYWLLSDALTGLDASSGTITTRLYTANNSNYYQWTTSTQHADLGGTTTGQLGRAMARAAVSQGGSNSDASGWYHMNLKLSDATTSGSPDITSANITRFSVTITTNSTNFNVALDDVRMFSETGDLWARVEPPVMIVKSATTLLGVFWFITSVAGGADELKNAFDRESITVSSTAIGCTASTIAPPGGLVAREALVHIRSGGPINWTVDGTNPTSTIGSGPWHLGSAFVISGATNISQFRAILDSSASTDAVIEVEYYR